MANEIRIPTNTNIEFKDGGFEDALTKCKAIEWKFDRLEEELTEMEGAPSALDRAVDNKEEKRVGGVVERNYAELKKNLDSIAKELKNMEGRLKDDDDRMDEKEHEIVQRKVSAYYTELQRKVGRAQLLYNQFKGKVKGRLIKQVKNIDVNNEYQDSNLDKIIDEDPEVLQRMVKQQVFGKASLKLQYAAQDISDKCEAIKALQRNVTELMDMLKQLAQIVSLQGEQINSIAQHCETAKEHMKSGETNLVKAKEHAKTSRCVGSQEDVHDHHRSRRAAHHCAFNRHPGGHQKLEEDDHRPSRHEQHHQEFEGRALRAQPAPV